MMRSVLLASCVSLILICHLADSVSIKRVNKFNDVDVAKDAKNAKQLGRKLNVHDQKATNELIALLKAKISRKHIREGEACPSSEILDLESDAFGLFLYPSNNPDQENDEGTTTEAEDEDELHEEEDQLDESAPGEPDLTGTESTNVNDDDDDDDDNDGEHHEKDGRKASHITTKSKRVLKRAHGKELADDEDLLLSILFDEGEDDEDEDTEENESSGEDDEEDEDSDEAENPDEVIDQDTEISEKNNFGKESLKASEYEELINLVRRNINRETSKRSKRSARANEYVSARGINDAITDVQCSHVIKTTQNVITVIVLADECDNGEVRLYNGDDNSSENPQVVKCGQTDPLIFNADGSVYIEYVYDSSSYYGGFGLLWIGSN